MAVHSLASEPDYYRTDDFLVQRLTEQLKAMEEAKISAEKRCEAAQ